MNSFFIPQLLAPVSLWRDSYKWVKFQIEIFSEKAKNVLLTKNPQFSSDFAQNFRDRPENFRDHLTKFELNRTKIVDFLLIVYFSQKYGF